MPRPPGAAFVPSLQLRGLPTQAARQLPEQSTTLRVAPTATGDTRIQGALHLGTSNAGAAHRLTKDWENLKRTALARFIYVHSRAVRDQQREQFFEVPSSDCRPP